MKGALRSRYLPIVVGLLTLLDPFALAAPSTGPDAAPRDPVIDLEPLEAGESSSLARSIGLPEALDLALADNLDLALARAEVQVARARHFSTRGALVAPSLQFGAGYGRTDGRVQGSFGNLLDVTFSTYQGGVSLLYDGNIGAQLNATIAAGNDLEAATLQTLDTEQRLILRVVELYQDLMLASVGAHIARQVIAADEEFLAIVEARAGAGLGLGADVARARAKLAADRQQLIVARVAGDATSRRLARTLLVDPRTRLVPRDTSLAPTHFTPAAPAEPSPVEPEARPDVGAARQRAEAARKQAQAAWWDLFAPDLRAEVRRFELGNTPEDLDGRSDYRGMLLWTISPEEIGTLRRRRAEEEAARLRALETSTRAVAEMLGAEQDLEAARAGIPLAGEEVTAAEASLRLSEARFKAGTAIALEVLDAQTVLAGAHFHLARTIVAYNSAQVRLLAAAGTLARNVFGPADGPF